MGCLNAATILSEGGMNRDTQKKDGTKTHIVSCDTDSQSLSYTAAQGKVQLARDSILN